MSSRARGLSGRVAAVGVIGALVLGACSSEDGPGPLAVPGSDSPAVATSASSTDSGPAPTTASSTASTSVAARPDSEAASTSSTTTGPRVPATSAPTSTTAAAPPTSTGSSTTTTLPAPETVLATLQAYLGGQAGTAAGPDAGPAVAIGWVNQEGGTPSFSDATTGLAAAVDYVNRNLGGIGGRVVELRTCAIQRAADGARCAQVLRDDPAVSVVLVGTVTLGNEALISGLKDVKPVVLTNPLTTADYLATDAVAYTPGSPGIIAGLARFATEGLPAGVPTKAAVVYPFGLAGEAAFQLLAKPVFDRAGIPVVPVAVLEGADPAAFAGVITNAGAADATVFLPILGSPGCIGLDQALRDLNSTASVLVTDACVGAAMTSWLAGSERSGALPDGWFVGGTGYRFGMGVDPAQDAYLQIVGEYIRANGLPTLDVTGYGAVSFAAMVTVVKMANLIGPDAITPDSMRAATRAFGGPMWNVVGPMRCGFNPFYPALCGTQMGVQRYVGGQFTPFADGYTGGSIDLTPLTAAPAAAS